MIVSRSSLVLCAVWMSAGCGGEAKDETGVSIAVGDTQLVREAQSAANGILRSASDCTAVEASYPDVRAKLDDVESRIQTEAGRTTLETLRKQVGTVAEACGVR